MPQFLTLRGRPALSPFRVAKLQAAFAASRPGHAVASIAADYWHFVAIDRALSGAERETLERLLTYGAHEAGAADGGELAIVVPRPGTISPWSSKATEIARNCGLAAVARVERGVGFRVATRGGLPLTAQDRAGLLPLLYDRMTEAVLPRLEDAGALFAHFPPRPLTCIPLLAEGRAAIVRANATLGLGDVLPPRTDGDRDNAAPAPRVFSMLPPEGLRCGSSEGLAGRLIPRHLHPRTPLGSARRQASHRQ
jgi:phosphoribosylformylglycinamidine synthase